MATQQVRSPVKRQGAEQLMLISLVSFALSIILTRLFLHLTGYPMIANETLHIAHVLWGGLLLFIASLLPLVWANYWALQLSAALGGIGVGLFIDEVGKFITMNNDYHFQPAAPIIYSSFLLTVFVYLRVRRSRIHTPREELYHILDDFAEVLDHDLDQTEHERLKSRLSRITEATSDENLKRLSNSLYQFLISEELAISQAQPTRTQRRLRAMADLFFRTVNQRRLKIFIILGLCLTGLFAFAQFISLVTAIPNPGASLSALLEPAISLGRLRSAQEAVWYLATIILEGTAGLLLIIAGGLMAIGREYSALRLASRTLIVWLAVINLFVFYFDQFSATAFTLIQFFLLLAVIYYRNIYHQSRKNITEEKLSGV